MNLFPLNRSQKIRTCLSDKGTGPKKVIFLGPVPEKLKKKFLCFFESFRAFWTFYFLREKIFQKICFNLIIFQMKKKLSHITSISILLNVSMLIAIKSYFTVKLCFYCLTLQGFDNNKFVFFPLHKSV